MIQAIGGGLGGLGLTSLLAPAAARAAETAAPRGPLGLGGFVRFKSPLKDPRDAAATFVVLGLGMACGHGNLGMACVGAAIVGLLLFAIDLISPASVPSEFPPAARLEGAA